MTVMPPAAAGYPDYQAYPNWRTPNLISADLSALATGTHDVAAVITQAYAAVALTASCTAGYGSIKLQWYEDAALTTPIGSDSWILATWVTTVVSVPARGPYVQLVITVDSAAAMNAGVSLAGENSSPGTIVYPVAVQRIYTGTVSVPASGQKIYPIPFMIKGGGTLNFVPQDTSGKLQCHLVTLNSNQTINQRLADFGTTTTSVYQQIAVSDDCVGVEIFNTDGTAAHSFQLQVVAGI